MGEPATTYITSWSLRKEFVSGAEFEVGQISLPRWITNRQVQRVLTEQAEVGGKGRDLVEAVDDHHQAQPL